MPREQKKIRGVFEKVKGSGMWWICYFDADGRKRREKAGTRANAITLYSKRKTEALQGKKLPETLRRRPITVAELLADAIEYAKRNHRSFNGDNGRGKLLLGLFGNEPANALTGPEIERRLMTAAEERHWKPATFNRYCAFLSVAYRLGLESGKIKSNPVRMIRHRRENNGRVRWLDEVEEARLRAVIEERYPEQLPAFDLALHTGMRKSEQYSLTWDCVDLDRRQLIIPLSKHGEIRYIPLDDTAVRALQILGERSNGVGPVMVASKNGHGVRSGHALKTPREWFTTACRVANIQNFTWHCLRHTFASRLTMLELVCETCKN